MDNGNSVKCMYCTVTGCDTTLSGISPAHRELTEHSTESRRSEALKVAVEMAWQVTLNLRPFQQATQLYGRQGNGVILQYKRVTKKPHIIY